MTEDAPVDTPPASIGRAPHVISPVPGYLLAAGLVGLLGGLVLLLVAAVLGLPWWADLLALAGGWGVLTTAGYRASALRFEADRLVIVRPHWPPRRVPWTRVHGAELREFGGSVDPDEAPRPATHLVTLRVLRHPETPLPPLPATFGEILKWGRTHFVRVTLPVLVEPGRWADPARAEEAAMRAQGLAARPIRLGRPGWRSARREQVTDEVCAELAARGFPVPGWPGTSAD